MLNFDPIGRRSLAQQYAYNDLEIRSTERQTEGDQVISHTHTVIFSRPLTAQEQQRFARLMLSFYDVVHFSRYFGDNLLAEPEVTFTAPDQARYTLHQRGVSGPWKDLLFALLATFSHEVVGIAQHDGSRAFDPAREQATTSQAGPEGSR